jgi:hypothetical protein
MFLNTEGFKNRTYLKSQKQITNRLTNFTYLFYLQLKQWRIPEMLILLESQHLNTLLLVLVTVVMEDLISMIRVVRPLVVAVMVIENEIN